MEGDHERKESLEIEGGVEDQEKMVRLYLPLSLEHMGYRPIAVDHDFLKTLRSWKDTGHIPTVEEIISLRQSYIGHPLERDLYGSRDIDCQE